MVACLQLAAEQLAKRSHYDFGMRAAVAVLNTAKHYFLYRAGVTEECSGKEPDKLVSEEKAQRVEAMTLCKALRVTNLPKLHPNDQIVFEEILRDVFDEDDLAAAEQSQPLKPFLIKAARDLLLEPSEEFLAKALQVSRPRHCLRRIVNFALNSSLSCGAVCHCCSSRMPPLPHVPCP